jgi:hypothetical protein
MRTGNMADSDFGVCQILCFGKKDNRGRPIRNLGGSFGDGTVMDSVLDGK